MGLAYRSSFLALVLLGTAGASAQTTEPSTRPAPAELSAEQMLSRMLKGPAVAAPLEPISESVELTRNDPRRNPTLIVTPTTRPTKSKLWPEGTFILDRPAHLQYDKSGLTLLVFEPDETGTRPPSMPVLANLKRMAMEQAAASTDRQLTFRVSGMVTEFRGRNYILLTQQPETDFIPVAPRTQSRPTTSEDRALSAEQMLSRMLRPAPGSARPLPAAAAAPADDKTSGAAAVAPGAPVLTLRREGTYVIDRVGRLTVSPDGAQREFTFDGDGRLMVDPPLILQPCQKLATMEDAARSANRDVRFRVTGVVSEYRARNYLLPEKVVVILDAEFQF